MAAKPTRLNADIPFGKDMFPYLLPWLMQRKTYNNDEIQHYISAVKNLSLEQTERRRTNGNGTVLRNHVAFALKEMSENGMHDEVDERTGTYSAKTDGILDYCIKNNITLERLVDEVDLLSLQMANMPESTEAERLLKQRIGQQWFRCALLRANPAGCPVTGIDDRSLLRAGHIKRWEASTDHERLDPNNGLLLAAHIDAAFEAGLITFMRSGEMLISSALSEPNRSRLGMRQGQRIAVSPERERYLAWHRENRFQRDQQASTTQSEADQKTFSLFDLPRQPPKR